MSNLPANETANPVCFACQTLSPVADMPHGTRLRTLEILVELSGARLAEHSPCDQNYCAYDQEFQEFSPNSKKAYGHRYPS